MMGMNVVEYRSIGKNNDVIVINKDVLVRALLKMKMLFGEDVICTLLYHLGRAVGLAIRDKYLSDNNVFRKTLDLMLKCVNPGNAVKIYVNVPSTVLGGEEFSVNVVARNTIASAKVLLKTIELYIDSNLLKAEKLDVEIPSLSEYKITLRTTLTSIGNHNLTVKLHYILGMYYGLVEKGSIKISVLNPVNLEVLTNETRPGGTLVFKVIIGLPYAKAKLQVFSNETESWNTIKVVRLIFPEAEIRTIAPYEVGKYMYRILLENGIENNYVTIVVNEKAYSKEVEEERTIENQEEIVKVKVSPNLITALPKNVVTLRATLSSEGLNVGLTTFNDMVGDWVLVSKANITQTSKTEFTINFEAPSNPGVYKYKVLAVKDGSKVGESDTVIVNVISDQGESKITQPVIPFEMFAATISTIGALSFIIWRKYKA